MLPEVADTSPNKLNGETVNMPARAMTGHNWAATEMNFNNGRNEYGAIYFHDDDLDDAAWKVDFEYQVPATLKSGVYAARLRAGNSEDHITFFVRPKKGTATTDRLPGPDLQLPRLRQQPIRRASTVEPLRPSHRRQWGVLRVALAADSRTATQVANRVGHLD